MNAGGTHWVTVARLGSMENTIQVYGSLYKTLHKSTKQCLAGGYLCPQRTSAWYSTLTYNVKTMAATVASMQCLWGNFWRGGGGHFTLLHRINSLFQLLTSYHIFRFTSGASYSQCSYNYPQSRANDLYVTFVCLFVCSFVCNRQKTMVLYNTVTTCKP